MDKTERIWEQAKKAASNKEGIKQTFNQAGNKLRNIASNSKEIKELKSKLEVLLRMIRAHVNGEYRSFPISTIGLIVFVLVYFITPTDLIPDFIPALGLTDDASVIFLIVRRLSRDIEQFHQWEEDQMQQSD